MLNLFHWDRWSQQIPVLHRLVLGCYGHWTSWKRSGKHHVTTSWVRCGPSGCVHGATGWGWRMTWEILKHGHLGLKFNGHVDFRLLEFDIKSFLDVVWSWIIWHYKYIIDLGKYLLFPLYFIYDTFLIYFFGVYIFMDISLFGVSVNTIPALRCQ